MAMLLCVLCSSALADRALRLNSPDGRVQLEVVLEDGKPAYRLSWKGRQLIEQSRLGTVEKGREEATRYSIARTGRTKVDETWEPVWGQFSLVRNHYRQLTVSLRPRSSSGGSPLDIVFRCYNDGMAFHYAWPEETGILRLADERTELRLADSYDSWWISGNWGIHEIDAPQPAGGIEKANTPLTMKVSSDCYMAVHEAALHDYPPMRLMRLGEAGRPAFRVVLNGPAGVKAPYRSPWRTVQLASHAGGLIESCLLQNLNRPLAIDSPSWIRPGQCVWDWRARGAVEDGFTYDLSSKTMKRFVDFAAENGVEYAMIDAGWYGPERTANPLTSVDGIDVQEVGRYARDRGVGLWLYINSNALKNGDLDRILSSYRDWGVVGIKHGFLDDPSQEGVEFCHRVVRAAAEYELMYNCHESIKPTGYSRTYPNFMTREYVHSLVDGPIPASSPGYVCTIPFVHNLGGPVDRTPGMFDLDRAIERDKVRVEIKSTVMGQVAQCLAIYTPLLCLPDTPEAYKRKMDLFRFIAAMPMTWDATRVTNAAIGRSITVARRSGDTWFVASMTDEEERTLTIPLDFLSEREYTATIYSDGPDAGYTRNRESYQVTEKTVGPDDTVKAHLAPGGGHAMWIKPAGM